MLRSIITLLLLLTISINQTFSQENMDSFRLLFTEVEFDVIHVYSFGRKPANLPKMGTYPFKGQEINNEFSPIVKSGMVLSNPDIEMEYSRFFATHRFYISGNLEGFLIREVQGDGVEHHIHYFIYDDHQKQFIKTINLSYAYAYEGGFGAKESWILDVDKDGRKDIITRGWRQYFHGSDGIEEFFPETSISLWRNGKLTTMEIADTLLQKQLETDFPYYEKKSLAYDTEQNLNKFLNEKTGQGIQNYSGENWCIVAGSDTGLESAKFEVKRAEEIIGFHNKYGLDVRHFEIYVKDGNYRTLITGFKTRTEAEIALKEIKEKFNKTAFVINVKDWCPNPEYKKGRYYYCK